MWSSFSNGDSLGTKGSEQGKIIRDDEHSLGARITLEKDGSVAPFSITCGIYGWMVHTRFFATEQEAADEYDRMKASIETIVARFGTADYEERETIEAIDRFVATYP